MNSKRKLLISMLAIVFVLLAVVATVAIAFALTQQTITTTLNIGYVVEDIDGTASATYTIGGVTESLTAKKGNQVIGDTLVFHAGDTEDAGNLMFPEGQIPLSAQNDNIVIQYTYSNTGAKHYIASMSFDGNISADNMKVEYSIDGTTYSENRYAVVVPANTSNKSYWIKISIENKAKSASFTGDFNWLLTGCDEQADSYLSLTSLDFKSTTNLIGETGYAVNVASAGSYVGELVFPREVNGTPLTTIMGNPNLTQAQRNQITSVYIPDTVTSLTYEVDSDAWGPFRNFTNLETVIFEQNETGSMSSQSGTGLKYIGDGTFRGCVALRNIQIPNTVTAIDYFAFEGAGLTAIEIPDSVTSLGPNSFAYCTQLTKVIVGSGLSRIGEASFAGCGVQTIKVDENNANFYAANDCLISTSGLAVSLPDKKIVVIPEGVTSLDWQLGSGLKNVEELTISGTVKSSGGELFWGCKSLKKVTIEEGFKNFGNADFGDCTNLEEMTIPSTVELDSNIYLGLPSKKLTIKCNTNFALCANGLSVETIILDGDEIDNGAIQGCTIGTVVITENVQKICEGAFYDATITTVIFEGEDDWNLLHFSGTGATNVTAEELKITQTAISFLTDTYVAYDWTRS